MGTKELGNSSPTNFEEKETGQNISGKNVSKLVGDKGEKIACEYLVKKGYKILAKNYRIKFGEIDIIAQKRWSLLKFLRRKNDKAIHFIEVKTLEGRAFQSNFFPEQRVDYKKQRKLIQLSQIWLEKNKMPQDYPYQIDVIGILIDRDLKKTKIHFFQNVVEER
jgi:putative endonuclease